MFLTSLTLVHKKVSDISGMLRTNLIVLLTKTVSAIADPESAVALTVLLYKEKSIMSYFTVQDWMVTELKLKGAERDAFAIVYGFSQDGESEFHGSLQYMSELTGYSRNALCTALNSLVEQELIIKEDVEKNHIKYCKYRTNYFNTVQATCTGVQATCTNKTSNKKPIQKTISKDIVEPDTKYSTDKNTKKKNLYQKCSDLVTNYTNNTELRVLLMECFSRFSENNRENGMPFYTNQFKGKLNTLSELATDATTQIKIVKQTLDNGWNNFYELKENKPRRRTGNVAHDIEHLYNGVNEKADKRCSDGEKF
jgi:DNA-binding transcriptional regulator GbsR (MarR family)